MITFEEFDACSNKAYKATSNCGGVEIAVNDTGEAVAWCERWGLGDTEHSRLCRDWQEIKFTAKEGDTLTVLCENMGRANFGSKMMRKKGIAGRCLINSKIHFTWEAFPLPMDNLFQLDFSKNDFSENSAFYRGYININEPCDTFLKLENFTKGFVTVNGFNIGRYWEIGPQKTLYVPKSIIKNGANEFIVFESDGLKGVPELELCDMPELE